MLNEDILMNQDVRELHTKIEAIKHEKIFQYFWSNLFLKGGKYTQKPQNTQKFWDLVEIKNFLTHKKIHLFCE